MVFGLCRLLLRDHHEAEDASQQTFVSAYRALLRGTEPREAGPWLAAIALIAAYQHQACPALQACAMTLLGCEPRGEVADLSHTVAERLRGADHVLAASSLEHVVRFSHVEPVRPA